MKKWEISDALYPALFGIGVLVFWQAVVKGFDVPAVLLPAPSDIWAKLITSLPTLWVDFVQTVIRAVIPGWIIGSLSGFLVAILCDRIPFLRRGLLPLGNLVAALPIVGVAPILVMWFGIGEVPAILTAFLISFFPIVVNVATGLATIEPELEDVLRALGASKLDVMRKVGIPRAMPYFFGSLKVAITLAFVGAVVSETIAANAGLGHLMTQAGSNFQMPLVFAGLLALAIEGIGMYAVTAWLEGRMTGWAFRSQQSAGG